MDDSMMQLGRVAYERWVEGMEGVIQMPGQVVMGLPPWTNSKVPNYCLPDDQKEIWAAVAVASIFAHNTANVESPRTIAITDDMINSIRSARLVGADERTYVLGVLMLAGFKVVDA